MRRLEITLDGEHAAKLTRLAELRHIPVETFARSLLSRAIDDADADPRLVVELLDGIAGAYERAQLGLEQAGSSQTVPLNDSY